MKDKYTAKYWTDQVKFCTDQAKYCTDNAKYWTDQVNDCNKDEVKYCTDNTKFWTDQAKFWTKRGERMKKETKVNKEIRANYNFTLNKLTHCNLRKLAQADCRSMSSMIEKLVKQEVEK